MLTAKKLALAQELAADGSESAEFYCDILDIGETIRDKINAMAKDSNRHPNDLFDALVQAFLATAPLFIEPFSEYCRRHPDGLCRHLQQDDQI